jgi:hydrogenase maturation factor
VNYIQPILDLVYNLIDRIGTKAAITVGVDYALIYLLYVGKVTEVYALGAVVIVTVGYFVQRVNEVKAKTGTEPTNTEVK